MTTLLEARSAAFDRGAGAQGAEPRWKSPLQLGAFLDRKIQITPPLAMVNDLMMDAITGRSDRVIAVLPPQEGKTVCARYAALLALQRNPELRIGVCSYGDRLARRIPRWCRNDIMGRPELGLTLAPDQKASYDWRLSNGIGGMYAAGYGGGWSGNPLDLLIVDDVFKDAKDADSEATRESVWDWWTSAATARFGEGASVIVINTRWHHDDLIGRLLKSESADEWRMLHIPAQADPEVIDPDPLGRAPGEFMVSARGRTRESWERRKRSAADKWDPEYQGDPRAPSGDLFDVSKLRAWHWNRDRTAIVCGPRVWRLDPETRDLWVFITMDTAFSTKTSADWTVASCWAVAVDGTLLLLDVQRARVPAHQQIDVARPLVDRWRPVAVYAEASSRSTLLVRQAMAVGWKMRDLVADKDKVTRAAPFARRVEHGEVWFPGGPDGIEADGTLLDYFRAEMKQFPAGRHDDAVDTGAYAARVAFEDYIPPPSSAPPDEPSALDQLRHATDVPRGFDPMSADF